MPPHPDAQVRPAQRLLRMVGELHKRGYQRIRVMPYIAAVGAWRCEIGPSIIFYRSNGARLNEPAWTEPSDKEQPRLAMLARYTAASGTAYFEWTDAKTDDARALADKFLDRFPRIAHFGRGWDYAYAGWFQHLLGYAEDGFFPMLFWEYGEPRPGTLGLQDVRPAEWLKADDATRRLPLPPPGDHPGSPEEAA